MLEISNTVNILVLEGGSPPFMAKFLLHPHRQNSTQGSKIPISTSIRTPENE